MCDTFGRYGRRYRCCKPHIYIYIYGRYMRRYTLKVVRVLVFSFSAWSWLREATSRIRQYCEVPRMRQDGSQFGRRLLVCICIAARRPPTPCPVAGVRRLFRTSFLVCHGIPSVYPVLNKNSENKGSVFLFRGTPRRYTLRILSSFCFRLGVKMRKRSDIQRPFRRPASNRAGY